MNTNSKPIYQINCEHDDQNYEAGHHWQCFQPAQPDYQRAATYARDIEGIHIKPEDLESIFWAALPKNTP